MYHCDDTKDSPDDNNNCLNIKLAFRIEELYMHLCFFVSIPDLVLFQHAPYKYRPRFFDNVWL